MKKYMALGLLAVLVIALICINEWLGKPNEDTDHDHESVMATSDRDADADGHLIPATYKPGRVGVVKTTAGTIEILFFEKDAPKTTAQIIGLMQNNRYNGVKFGRVEATKLIQVDAIKPDAPKINLEIRDGMDNVKGAVGMARSANRDSATSAFYILIEPMLNLNGDYAVFGRVISGMDVVMKMKSSDKIIKTTIRNSTKADEEKFNKVRTMAAERNVQ